MLALISIALAAATLSSGCNRHASASRVPPATLLPALATRFPNGVEISAVSISLNPAGRVLAVTFKGNAILRGAVTAWAKNMQFVPAKMNCKSVAGTVVIDTVDFYPPASGIVGFPRIVAGVDFDNLTYTDGPGGPDGCETAHMHNGIYDVPGGENIASVGDIFTGHMGGSQVALVILRCDFGAHGFDSQAQLFEIANGEARRLGILGSGGMTGPDSSLPPWPGGWIHVAFSGGKLYADVWDDLHACDRNRDWVSSAYAIRGHKLALLNQLHHHRKGLAPACTGPPTT